MRSHSIVVMLLGTLLSLATIEAQAEPMISSTATWNIYDRGNASSTSSSTLDSSTVTLEGVIVSTDYGVHRIQISETISYAPDPQNSHITIATQGVATSFWQDTFTIFGDGESPYFIPVMRLDGSLIASEIIDSGGADLNIQFGGGPFSVSSAFLDLQNVKGNGYGPMIIRIQAGTYTDGDYSVTAPPFNGNIPMPDTVFEDGVTFIYGNPIYFQYGVPFEFGSAVKVIAGAGGSAFLGNTLRASFILPAGASLVAASGAQYAIAGAPDAVSSVPEPNAGLLVALGLILILEVTRRNGRLGLPM